MAFRNWFSIPVVQADDEEELVDPQAALRVRNINWFLQKNISCFYATGKMPI